jgi:hypothetical protein
VGSYIEGGSRPVGASGNRMNIVLQIISGILLRLDQIGPAQGSVRKAISGYPHPPPLWSTVFSRKVFCNYLAMNTLVFTTINLSVNTNPEFCPF